ncbi:MAG: hypothetical protein ACREAK_03660 [Nitrosarchaeum sp.]
MVLPIIDENKPKCYLCHIGFENIEKLRVHQNTEHKEFFESHEKNSKREPAPGDVTVF